MTTTGPEALLPIRPSRASRTFELGIIASAALVQLAIGAYAAGIAGMYSALATGGGDLGGLVGLVAFTLVLGGSAWLGGRLVGGRLVVMTKLVGADAAALQQATSRGWMVIVGATVVVGGVANLLSRAMGLRGDDALMVIGGVIGLVLAAIWAGREAAAAFVSRPGLAVDLRSGVPVAHLVSSAWAVAWVIVAQLVPAAWVLVLATAFVYAFVIVRIIDRDEA